MQTGAVVNPLEQFLRDYAEAREGAWEQVEPQVYDLLWPEAHAAAVLRVALDPEAVPDHPGCRFAGLGAPLLDEMLESAQSGARYSRGWITGLSCRPGDLAGHLRQRLDLQGGARLAIERTEAMEFASLIHWFRATYVSDQKEQDTFCVAIDGESGRQIRHLDRLADWGRLIECPVAALPEAPRLPLPEMYRLARDRVARTASAAANTRRRELEARHRKQEARMLDYYSAMEAEIDQQIARAQAGSEAAARAVSRRASVGRERQRRLEELRRKSALRVHLSLTNLLEIRQPKLRVEATLTLKPEAPRGHRPGATMVAATAPAPVILLWDPLIESVEAPSCPMCRRPTYAIRTARSRPGWTCPGCDAAAGPR